MYVFWIAHNLLFATFSVCESGPLPRVVQTIFVVADDISEAIFESFPRKVEASCRLQGIVFVPMQESHEDVANVLMVVDVSIAHRITQLVEALMVEVLAPTQEAHKTFHIVFVESLAQVQQSASVDSMTHSWNSIRIGSPRASWLR